MGRTYLFECEKCGYRAPVAGGISEGNDIKVQTVICRDCRALYDCVVALRVAAASRLQKSSSGPYKGAAPSLQSALARLPSTPREGRQWIQFDAICPVDPTHRVARWSLPGRCPRCKAYLESAAVPYRLWD